MDILANLELGFSIAQSPYTLMLAIAGCFLGMIIGALPGVASVVGAFLATIGLMLLARAKANCPLVMGRLVTCGADDAVDWMVDITKEIAAEQGPPIKIAVLKSGRVPEVIATSFDGGGLLALPNAPESDAALIRSCSDIVALSGAAQISAALHTGEDIVIAGRATDTAIIAAVPLERGCHPGGAWHGARIGVFVRVTGSEWVPSTETHAHLFAALHGNLADPFAHRPLQNLVAILCGGPALERVLRRSKTNALKRTGQKPVAQSRLVES